MSENHIHHRLSAEHRGGRTRPGEKDHEFTAVVWIEISEGTLGVKTGSVDFGDGV